MVATHLQLLLSWRSVLGIAVFLFVLFLRGHQLLNLMYLMPDLVDKCM